MDCWITGRLMTRRTPGIFWAASERRRSRSNDAACQMSSPRSTTRMISSAPNNCLKAL
jgi:hypothetical protein